VPVQALLSIRVRCSWADLLPLQFPPENRQRAMQMALYRSDRHIQNLRYLTGVEILLIAQQDPRAGVVRQRFDQPAEPVAQQRILRYRIVHRLRRAVEADAGTKTALADLVDGAMADRPAEPPRGVRG